MKNECARLQDERFVITREMELENASSRHSTQQNQQSSSEMPQALVEAEDADVAAAAARHRSRFDQLHRMTSQSDVSARDRFALIRSALVAAKHPALIPAAIAAGMKKHARLLASICHASAAQGAAVAREQASVATAHADHDAIAQARVGDAS